MHSLLHHSINLFFLYLQLPKVNRPKSSARLSSRRQNTSACQLSALTASDSIADSRMYRLGIFTPPAQRELGLPSLVCLAHRIPECALGSLEGAKKANPLTLPKNNPIFYAHDFDRQAGLF